jgi:hypothetical protein
MVHRNIIYGAMQYKTKRSGNYERGVHRATRPQVAIRKSPRPALVSRDFKRFVENWPKRPESASGARRVRFVDRGVPFERAEVVSRPAVGCAVAEGWPIVGQRAFPFAPGAP